MTSIVKGSHGAVLRPELMLEDVSVRLGDVDVLSAISLRVQERRVAGPDARFGPDRRRRHGA